MFEPTDKSARETAVAAAVLWLLARDGDAALTARRLAAEAQIPPTSLWDQFPFQNAVRAAMMRAVVQRIKTRIDALPSTPYDAVRGRSALSELLPFTQQRRQEAIATVYIGAAELHDPDRCTAWELVKDTKRETCRRALDAMGLGRSTARLGQLDSLIDGLTSQMLKQAHAQPAMRRAEVLDRMLPS